MLGQPWETKPEISTYLNVHTSVENPTIPSPDPYGQCSAWGSIPSSERQPRRSIKTWPQPSAGREGWSAASPSRADQQEPGLGGRGPAGAGALRSLPGVCGPSIAYARQGVTPSSQGRTSNLSEEERARTQTSLWDTPPAASHPRKGPCHVGASSCSPSLLCCPIYAHSCACTAVCFGFFCISFFKM